MNDIYKKFIGALIAVYVLTLIRMAQAAPITSGETIISKPVGQGLLPGGGTEGVDIQSSVLFAKIIPFLISWGINLAVGLAVIAVIWGGYQYMTAFGNEEKRSKGTRILTYALIGLVLALTAYGIVSILTSIQLS